jgi:hypothetical protein
MVLGNSTESSLISLPYSLQYYLISLTSLGLATLICTGNASYMKTCCLFPLRHSIHIHTIHSVPKQILVGHSKLMFGYAHLNCLQS